MIIFLTGFMGCGKSSIGLKLAQKISAPFIDMDEQIESRSGKSITEIFHSQGESVFREMEKEVITQLVKSRDNIVVATGGGTACFFDNMEVMNKNGISVYIKTSPELLFSRLKDDARNRPLLTGQKDLKTFITKKLAERKKYYKKSKYIIEFDQSQTEEEILEKILKLIKNLPDGN
ncbi:MAG TPA: shikimate kinase [Bacteroidales bacterium]|nr:shikimate kinase [Bacteroidales bacterium]